MKLANQPDRAGLVHAAVVGGELCDGRIALTWFCAADAPVMVDGDADPELRSRFGFPAGFTPSLEHSLSVIARWEDERAAESRLTFAIRDVEHGLLLGGCELQPRNDLVANVSYWTYPAHRNRAVAARALALVVKLAFNSLGTRSLEVCIEPDNHRSLKVALRNGFAKVGVRDGMTLLTLDNTTEPLRING
jgi:RimJ/RimL family protein N-acetyltransferase